MWCHCPRHRQASHRVPTSLDAAREIQEKLVEGGSRLTAALLEVGQLRERLDKSNAVKRALKEQVRRVVGRTRLASFCGRTEINGRVTVAGCPDGVGPDLVPAFVLAAVAVYVQYCGGVARGDPEIVGQE